MRFLDGNLENNEAEAHLQCQCRSCFVELMLLFRSLTQAHCRNKKFWYWGKSASGACNVDYCSGYYRLHCCKLGETFLYVTLSYNSMEYVFFRALVSSGFRPFLYLFFLDPAIGHHFFGSAPYFTKIVVAIDLFYIFQRGSV